MSAPPPAAAVDRDRWETFAHGADVGVRGTGPTCAQAFEAAATALAAIVTDPARIEPRRAVALACAAPSPAMLLVAWLDAVIYEMVVGRMLFSRFAVSIDCDRLTATAWGETIDVDRHEPAVEPKGATLTALGVDRQPDGSWRAQCVVDV